MQPPVLTSSGQYRPHLVVQARTVRRAQLGQGDVPEEDYLGVEFVQGLGAIQFGAESRYTIRLLFPLVDYSALRSGATFTIREGHRVVGHGIVLEEATPPER
jgi:hypothetical protein